MHNNNNGYPSSTRAWMTVAILMLAYVLSFVDRQILNLLVEPIRRDLDITDTHMSLLMGFSFAVFYTICGVPIGRLADRTGQSHIRNESYLPNVA
jgi:MFS family permease